MQTLYLATHFNPIYWNTACLIVNSGSINEQDDDSTNYVKIAKALGAILSEGVKVSLADINHSGFGFKPDVKNNQILFGLKSLVNVGADVVNEIIAHRPYVSIKDFCNKVKIKKQSMISLIKGGAFDNLHPDRKFVMAWYIWETCDKKKRITLQNMNGLATRDLLPTDEPFTEPYHVYEFNRYLKDKCKKDGGYELDNRAVDFIVSIGEESIMFMNQNNKMWIPAKAWDKVYKRYMNVFKTWMTENQQEILDNLNSSIFYNDWIKYAKNGNISAWEMEALCFYYHEHELAHINKNKYGIVDFIGLPTEPVVESTFKRGKNTINLYKLSHICGTCIAKDKTKSTIYLLTTTGVVEVKFRKEYFAIFDKRISQKRPDGTKQIVEKSWFERGSLLLIQGVRQGDTFMSKKYKSSGGHQLYKIDKILENGDITLRNERFKGEEEEDEQ